MNTYLLIRDNHETGPHTLEELKDLTLRNLDLIWVEGKSKHWDYATEFTELKPFIVNSPSSPGRKIALVQKPPSDLTRNLPLHGNASAAKIPGLRSEKEPAAFALRNSTEEVAPAALAERSAETSTFQFPKRRNSNGSLWILSLLLMLMFGAFIVKKLVDDRAQQALVQSAFIALAKEETKADKDVSALKFQHAISTEKVAEPKNKAERKVHPEAVKSKVRVANNDYRVGLLGGVDDLQINVTNGSTESLEAVSIQIKFLKPNGKVIRTENHKVYAVGPNTTKILVIPPAKRGVKVAYSVTDVSLKTPKVFVGKA